MTPDNPTPPPSRPGRTEPWRVERMVQRVPAHLGEATPQPVSPWLALAGIALLILFSCGVLFVILNVPERLKGLTAAAQPTATRTPRAVSPAVTILPATLPPPTPTTGPTAVVTKYKIKAGDSLIAIAAKYKVTVQAIMTANNLKDETIRIGDELIIPLPTPTAPGVVPQQIPSASTPTPISLQVAPSPAAASTPGIIRYTVAKGDTLISIAATYGSTADGIRIASQMSGDMLSIGQVLSVPVGAWTPTALPTSVAAATVTPTSQYAYVAPSLQWPPDGQVLRGTDGAPTLEWAQPAMLKNGELYVLRIDYTKDGQKNSIVEQVKVPQYQLKAAQYPGASTNGTVFTWYVVIVNSGTSGISPQARADARNTQSVAVSPPSESRSFVWY